MNYIVTSADRYRAIEHARHNYTQNEEHLLCETEELYYVVGI